MTDFVINDHLLTKEAESLACEIWEESGKDEDSARDLAHSYADGHEWVIYYHKAIALCANCDTAVGESWLEDCGGIAQDGDSFGAIACRIAYAELLCRIESALSELIEEESE